MKAPKGLSKRGTALWTTLDGLFDLTGPQGILAHEACRLADRLEKLDLLLSGNIKEWARIKEARFEGDDTVLIINSAASEARQQQLALKQLLAAIGVKDAPAARISENKSALDELSKRRDARNAGAPRKARAARPVKRPR